MLPGDRLVCAFVRPQPPASEFAEWPLHVTIVPWFRAEVPSERLAQQLEDRYRSSYSFLAYVGEEAVLGSGRLVNLLDDNKRLQSMERGVRSLLKSYDAWIVDETTRRQRTFRPHVTAQKRDRLHVGDSFVCDSLSIVLQLGDRKIVDQEVRFGDG